MEETECRVVDLFFFFFLSCSGTTGKPKGVVTTHKNIEAQVQMLVEAWGWTSNDRMNRVFIIIIFFLVYLSSFPTDILQVLPLHHVHGIVAVLLSSLWAGATCEMQLGFNAADVWERLMKSSEISLFMAVPTIYCMNLLQFYLHHFSMSIFHSQARLPLKASAAHT